MPRILTPTDLAWNRSQFNGARGYTASTVKLRTSIGGYQEKGSVVSPVIDLGAGINAYHVASSRGIGDPGSLDSAPILSYSRMRHRASSTSPTFASYDDDFSGYGLDTNRWTVVTQSGSATYSQTDGKLAMACSATDGDKLMIRSNESFASFDGTANLIYNFEIEITDYPQTADAGTHWFGMVYGESTYSPGVSNNMCALLVRIDSDGPVIYQDGRNNAGSGATRLTPIGYMPDKMEFSMFVRGGYNGRYYAYYRPDGRQWYHILTGGTDPESPSTGSPQFYLTLWNETANGNTIGMNVTMFEKKNDVHCLMPGSSNTGTAWTDQDIPSKRDVVFGNVAMVDHFDEYTDSLDVMPTLDATLEDWSEGLATNHKLPSQHQCYVDDSTGISAIVNSTNNRLEISATTAVTDGSYYLWIPAEVDHGMTQSVPTGAFQITNYYTRSGLAYDTDDILWLIALVDENGTTVSEYSVAANDAVSSWKMQVRQAGGSWSTLPEFGTWTANFSGGGSWQYHWIIAFDTTQNRTWLLSNVQGFQHFHTTTNHYETFLSVGTSAANATGDPMLIDSPAPISAVHVYSYFHNTASVTSGFQWTSPTVVIGKNNIVSTDWINGGSVTDDFPCANVKPWWFPTHGSSSSSYFQTGRYNQYAVDLTGE